MSQKKEKYARRMEKRMNDLERQTEWLWRTFASKRIEGEVSDRRIRYAKRRAVKAERAAGIWRTVAMVTVLTALIVLLLFAVVLLASAVWSAVPEEPEPAAAVTVQAEPQSEVQILSENE